MNETPSATDETPVEEMNASEASKGVAESFLGTPAPETPPVETPVIKNAPTSTPPVETPPVETPPVETPPVETPPTETTPKSGMPDDITKKIIGDETPPVEDDFDANAIKLEDLDEKVRPNFAKMRDKLNGTEKDLQAAIEARDALQARIDSGENADPEAMKTLQDQNTELMDMLGRVSLEFDPRFQEKHNTITAPIVASLTNTLNSYNVEDLNAEEVIAFASQLSPADRTEFLAAQLPEDVSTLAASTLLPIFAQLDVANNQRKAEVDNHRATLEAMDSTTTEQANTEIAQAREQLRAEVLTQTRASEPLLQTSEGFDDWNKGVEDLNKEIDAVFASDDPKLFVQSLVDAQVGKRYKALYAGSLRELDHLRGVLQQRNITIPSIDGKRDEAAPKTIKSGEMTVAEAVARTAKAAGF